MSERNGQVLIGFKCSPEFRAQVRRAAGKNAISQFVREALIDKIRSTGVRVNEALADAPSRTGKGGPKKKTPPPGQSQSQGQ